MIRISYLEKHLRYDPCTGHLWWRLAKQGRILSRPAGRITKKRYIDICINYKHYRAHRIIWFMRMGSWPKREVDHKNHKRWHNRWKNLRAATTVQNRWNALLRSDNSSGYKGVSRFRNIWRARAYDPKGKEKHLGLFRSKKAARIAYIQYVRKHRGEFAHV